MPRYSVWAYVRDIRESLGPFCEVLNEHQLRRRAREGFELLQKKIKEVPHIDGITEHRRSASVTIATSADVSLHLKDLGLGFIELGDIVEVPEETPRIPLERTFYITPSIGTTVTFARIEEIVTALGGRRHSRKPTLFIIPANGEKDPVTLLFGIQEEFTKRNIAIQIGLAPNQ